MQRLRPWLDAAKPEQAVLAPLAVVAGAACAGFDARPDQSLVAPVLAAVAAMAAGCGINLLETAWDLPGQPGPDPKRPIPEQDRSLELRDAVGGGVLAIGIAAVVAFVAAWLAGAAVLGYGAASIALGVWRRAPAVGADTLGFGLGDLATAAALGPLAVLAGFAARGGEGATAGLYAGCPIGLAAAAAGYLRHFTRRDVDEALHRMTPVATLGEERAGLGIVLLPLLAAVAVGLAWRSGEYAPAAWLACLPPVAAACVSAWWLRQDDSAATFARVERVQTRAAMATAAIVALTFWLSPST
jgi:1,4-dihydroxy-2-naphthoate octaprenyltransferase